MRRNMIPSLIAIVLIAVAAQTAFAGLNRWTKSELEGGYVSAIAVAADEKVVYAATPGGVFKSEDGGTHWRSSNAGLNGQGTYGIALVPGDSSKLYAVGGEGKLFRSTDSGATWVQVATPETAYGIVIVGRTIFVASTRAVHRSTDDGATWQVSFNAGTDHAIGRLAASPSGSSLFVISRSIIHRSTDEGLTWTRLPFSPSGSGDIVAQDDGTLYVSAHGSLVWKSVDGGATMTPLKLTSYARGYIYAMHAHDNHLYVSFGFLGFRSSPTAIIEHDGNTATTRVGPVDSVVTVLATAPQSGRMYAGTDSRGVFVKEPASDAWVPSSEGMNGAPVTAVAVSPLQPAIVYATSTAGSFKSVDYGGTWQKIAESDSFGVAVDPLVSDVAYIATDAGVQKTADGGSGWDLLRGRIASGVTVAPSDTSVLYAAFADGFAKSENGGMNWRSINNGLSLYMYYDYFEAPAPAVHPNNPDTAYVITDGRINRTNDGGATWAFIGQSMGYVTVVAIDPTDGQRIYAATSGQCNSSAKPCGLNVSSDGGATWTRLGFNTWLSALAINPASPNELFISSEGVVLRSRDRGASFQPFGDQLTYVSHLSIDASGHFLHAVTSRGVYSIEMSPLDIVPVASSPTGFATLLSGLSRAAQEGAPNAGIVFPVVGLSGGLFGTSFDTDLTLHNDRASDQEVVLAWLPQANTTGEVSMFSATLPANSSVTAEALGIPNIVRRLGLSGLGSLVIVGVGNGGVDSAANIRGSARICARLAGKRPECQSVEGVRADLFGRNQAARITGLRTDAGVRTNIGIVNLDSDAHTYRVVATGERAAHSFDLHVPPFSLIQTGIPHRDFGPMTVDVTSDGDDPFLTYGSSIDNATAAATTRVGAPNGN